MQQKDFVVWYNGGSGGFIISWLIQVALNPDALQNAYLNFPVSLKDNHSQWKKYECIPDQVGLLCNVLDPSLYYQIDRSQYAKQILSKIDGQPHNIYDNFFCRSKFYLTNYIHGRGHTSLDDWKDVGSAPEKFGLDNQKHFQTITDVLFDPKKCIFVCAPVEYQALAQKTKGSRNIDFDLTSVITDFPILKKVDIRHVWQKQHISMIEQIIERKLPVVSRNACNRLVDHYLSVAPTELSRWCYSQWCH